MALLAASTGVLDETMLGIISDAFSSLSGTVAQVLTISVPVAVGVIALTAGINYALKKVKGVLKKAE